MRDVDLWLLLEFEVQLEVLVEPLKCLRITASSSEFRLKIITGNKILISTNIIINGSFDVHQKEVINESVLVDSFLEISNGN